MFFYDLVFDADIKSHKADENYQIDVDAKDKDSSVNSKSKIAASPHDDEDSFSNYLYTTHSDTAGDNDLCLDTTSKKAISDACKLIFIKKIKN